MASLCDYWLFQKTLQINLSWWFRKLIATMVLFTLKTPKNLQSPSKTHKKTPKTEYCHPNVFIWNNLNNWKWGAEVLIRVSQQNMFFWKSKSPTQSCGIWVLVWRIPKGFFILTTFRWCTRPLKIWLVMATHAGVNISLTSTQTLI